MEEINYQDVIDLGFKREDHSCHGFFQEYGFTWFLVTLKLTKYIYMDWDCNTRKVTINKIDKEHTILSSIGLENLEEVRIWVNFFKAKKNG